MKLIFRPGLQPKQKNNNLTNI